MKRRKKSTFVGSLAALNSAKVIYVFVLSILKWSNVGAEISIDSKNYNNKKVVLTLMLQMNRA